MNINRVVNVYMSSTCHISTHTMRFLNRNGAYSVPESMWNKCYWAFVLGLVIYLMGVFPCFHSLSLNHKLNKGQNAFALLIMSQWWNLAIHTSPFSPIRLWELLLKLIQRFVRVALATSVAIRSDVFYIVSALYAYIYSSAGKCSTSLLDGHRQITCCQTDLKKKNLVRHR